MRTFRQSRWSLLTSVLYAAAGMAMAGFLVRTFLSDNALCYAVLPAAVWLAIAWSTLVSGRRRIELTDDGRLLIFRRGKMEAGYRVSEVRMSCSLTVTDGDTDFRLFVTTSDGRSHSHYFTEFSEDTCRAAAKALGIYDPDKPVKVETVRQ